MNDNIKNSLNKVTKIQVRNIQAARGSSNSDAIDLSVRLYDPSQPNVDLQGSTGPMSGAHDLSGIVHN